MQGDQLHTHGFYEHRHGSAPDHHRHPMPGPNPGESRLDGCAVAVDDCESAVLGPKRQMSAIEAAQEVYRDAVRAEKAALADAELAATLGRKLWQVAAEKSEQVGDAQARLLQIAAGDLLPRG